MKMANILESKRSIAGMLMLGGLIFTTYNIQENSQKIKKLTNFESGMHTCFSRVNQTYTAKLLGDSTSGYLNSNFHNLTEECFAEGILNVEDSFKADLSHVAKKLSTLASNVHWFHEDILSNDGSAKIGTTGEARDVGARFEKIETTKDEILESTEQYKGQVSQTLNQQKSFFYVTSTLLVLLMIFEYMTTTKRKLLNLTREKEAEGELLDNGGATSVKMGEIIRSALEQNNLVNCSKLFSNYYMFHSFEKVVKGKNKLSLETLITPVGLSAHSSNDKIEKIWNDDNFGVAADSSQMNIANITNTTPSMNLENTCSTVVDMLAEKLFSKGVKIDVNIPENLKVGAGREDLEQSLFHLLTYAINSTGASLNGERSVSVFAHKLGDVIAFDLIYSGEGFEEEFLKQRIGLSTSDSSLDVDLLIAQTLLNEMSAKVQFDNKINQNGENTGGRIKIIFKGPGAENTQNHARLVDLKIGSKKDILASMGQI